MVSLVYNKHKLVLTKQRESIIIDELQVPFGKRTTPLLHPIPHFSYFLIRPTTPSSYRVSFGRTNTKLLLTVTIPYIKGTSETSSQILLPYNIRVAHKPTTTIRNLLTNVKDWNEPNNIQGAVYKIKCSDCQASH